MEKTKVVNINLKSLLCLLLSMLVFFLVGCEPEEPPEDASTELKIKYILAEKAYANKSDVDFTSYGDQAFIDLLYYCEKEGLNELAKKIEEVAGASLGLDYKNLTQDTLLVAIVDCLSDSKKPPAKSPIKSAAQKATQQIPSELVAMKKQLADTYSEFERRLAEEKQLTQQEKDKIADNIKKVVNPKNKEEPGTIFGSSFRDLEFWKND